MREGGADLGEQVVDEDEDDGDDEAGGFTSTFGGDAEGDADEHEDETGKGIGEALVELDAVDEGWRPLVAAWALARRQSSESESASILVLRWPR